jgi:hypothetical protein
MFIIKGVVDWVHVLSSCTDLLKIHCAKRYTILVWETSHFSLVKADFSVSFFGISVYLPISSVLGVWLGGDEYIMDMPDTIEQVTKVMLQKQANRF